MNSNQKDLTVEYFEVDDPLEEEKKDEPSSLVTPPSGQAYCEFKAEFDRETFDELRKQADDKPKTNSADVLVFFADKSGSMSGTPFTTVRNGLIDMADTIFGATEEQNAFQSVHTVWFDDHIEPHVTSQKADYIANLRKDVQHGGTNFYPCFEYIENLLKKVSDGTRVSVVFLTDGQGSYGPESMPNLKNLAKKMAIENDKPCAIYTLGFSAGHDAALLNGLAQSGSETGNFIYIPFEGDYMAKLKESLESSLAMAIGARGQRLTFTKADQKDFKISKPVKAEYAFPEPEKQDDEMQEASDKMEDEDQIDEKDESTWSTVTFSTSALVSMNDLQSGNLVMTMSLGDDIVVECKPLLVQIAEPSEKVKSNAALDVINTKTFELIQEIQSAQSAEDRKKALDQLVKIDNALNLRMKEFQSFTDRSLKKELLTKLMEKKMESAKVIGLLRGIQDLSYLDNSVIAQINDVAYKAVQTNQLQKMLDKRALANEERYKKLDAEIDEIVAKIDTDELRKKYSHIIDEIGNCALSCMDACEALEMGDCMCIALEIEKPEAAIADPSRLIIKNIVPTYATSETFLQSAKFALKDKQRNQQHRYGYQQQQQQPNGLMTGVGNEKVNGIMPLYLFDQHWWLAKRKISPVIGFMVTDDVLGYTTEQLHTVPFVVLIKAMEQQNEAPTECNKRVLELIEETCVQMIRHNKGLRRLVAQQVHAFAYQPNNVSARTLDVVKSVKVLAAQFVCLLKAGDMPKQLSQDEELADIADHFTDAEKLTTMQTRFYRAAVEEQMRSFVDKSFSDFFLSVLDKYLLKGVDKFVESTFDRRAKELEVEAKGADGDMVAQYAKMASDLRSKYGYDKGSGNQINEEVKVESVVQITAKKINLDEELTAYLKTQTFLTGEAIKLVEKVGTNYDNKPVFNELRMLCKALIGQEFANLRAMPGFGSLSDDDYNLVLLATVIQNAHHKENKQRVLAVKEGRYMDILTASDARVYLEGLLSKKLKEQLLQRESVIVKKSLSSKVDAVVDKVLAAPDAFTAAAMIKVNKLSIGRGDFRKAIVKLIEGGEAVPDLTEKLVLLKTGFFMHQDLLKRPITDEVLESIDNEKGMPLFADKFEKSGRLAKDNHCITAKHVFKLWSKHVYVGKSLTQEQIENIFPEFVERLQLYGKCCDETGKAVRNLDVYKQYRATPHAFRKRGGLKKDPAQQKAKQAYATKVEAAKGPDEKREI